MKILTAISLIAALSMASESDYQDEIEAKKTYCEQVQHGNWPAFDENIKCGELNGLN